MPVYYVERALLGDRVTELESEGEVVTALEPEGDNFWIVTQLPVKRRAAGSIETRPAQ